MGLDWCLRDKQIEGQEHNSKFAEVHCERINKEIDEEYTAFLKEKGVEAPMYFPNDITEEFRETPAFRKLHIELSGWQEARRASVITPMQTMGCPRIGIDNEATEWAENYYKEIQEKKGTNELNQDRLEQFFAEYPTVEDYIEKQQGCYVAELAKNKDGLGSITGIAVGPESFRGKVLRYIEWLPEELVDEAYDDHEPNDLEEYGNRLLAAARDKEIQLEGVTEEGLKEEIETVKAAGSWCVFWGENGHGMHAWY